MKNKGFTLVELLAVIAILAVLAMVAYSVIANNIEVARKETFKVSVNNVLEAAKEYATVNFTENDFPKEGISVRDLDLKKDTMVSGVIKRDENNIINVIDMSDGNYCANGTKNNLTITKGECDRNDLSKPNIEVKVKNVSLNSVKVLVKMQEPQSGLKSLEYCNKTDCKKIDLLNERNEVKEIIKFDKLEANKNYTFKFIVESNNENSEYNKNETEISVTTKVVAEPTFKVSSSTYTQSKILKIIYPNLEGYIYKYSINDLEEIVVDGLEKELELTSEAKVTATIYDSEGNKVASDEIIIAGIDDLAPVTDLVNIALYPEDIENYNGFAKNYTLELEAYDEGTGLALRPYSYDEGKTWEKTNKHTYTKNGEYKVYTRDRLGNINKKFCDPNKTYNGGSCVCTEEECKFIIEIVDGEGPTCPSDNEWIGESTDWTNENRTLTINCTDLGSGCEKESYSYTYNGEAEQTEIKITMKDKIGNESTCSKYANVYVDKTKPSCGSYSGESTSWTSNDRTISFDCTDNVSGCKQVTYSKVFNTSTKVGSWSQVISDEAGNETTCSSNNLNVYVDKVVPSISCPNTSFTGGARAASSFCSTTCGISGCSVTYSPTTIPAYRRTTLYATIRSNSGLSSSTSASIGYYYDGSAQTSCYSWEECRDETISVKQTMCCDEYNGCYGCPESEIRTVCGNHTSCYTSGYTCPSDGSVSGSTCYF